MWVADGRATALRRIGRSAGRQAVSGRDGDVIELDIGAPEWLAREVAGYGKDALVLEPAPLREDVVARLTAAAQGGS